MLREAGDSLARRIPWTGQRDRLPLIDRDLYRMTFRYLGDDLRPEHSLGVLDAELRLRTRAVEHHGADGGWVRQHVKHVERDAQVLQRQHVGRAGAEEPARHARRA